MAHPVALRKLIMTFVFSEWEYSENTEIGFAFKINLDNIPFPWKK